MSTPIFSAWSDESGSDGFGFIDTYNAPNASSSDDYGTIESSYGDYIDNQVEVEVHKAQGSQTPIHPEIDSEATVTDPDAGVEDHILTPGQRTPPVSVQLSQEDMDAINIELMTQEENKRKRNENASSEEDNNIVMKTGSFVNSDFHEEKKVKMDNDQGQRKTPADSMEVEMEGAFTV